MSDEETTELEETGELPEQRIYRVAAPSSLVYREDGDDGPVLEGMVVPYGQWAEVDSAIEGHFMERFAAGSLRKSFTETLHRIKGYFEHGKSRKFDRMPIMDIRRAWEEDDAAFYRASPLSGLPEEMIDGMRKGIYGTSLGAAPVKVQRNRRPGKSDHNPQGIEERTYTELRVYDISLTPSPHYDTPTILRSSTDEVTVQALLQAFRDHPELLPELFRQTQAPTEVEVTEPPHSEREEQEDPAPERSRSTQPSRDYLQPEKGAPSWRL